MPQNKNSENEREPQQGKGTEETNETLEGNGTPLAMESKEIDTWVSEETLPDKEQPETPETGSQGPSRPAPKPIEDREARTWAMLAHLSILLNTITGWLGMLGALIIYLVYKDRSRMVAYHAMQSLIFQAITWIGAGIVGGILIGIGSALAFLIIPLLCLIPGILILLLIPVSLIYGVIGAVKVNNGEDFRYWQVGDWVRGILEPKPSP